MEGFNETILSADQQERKEKFEKFLPVIDMIKAEYNSPKFESHITDNFKEQMENSGIDFKKYYLYTKFFSYLQDSEISESELPEEYDTEDKKIESIILNLAKDLQEEAA